MKNRGLSLIPVLVGIVVSVILIGILTYVTVARQERIKQEERLAATHLSDYGFQTVMSEISGIEGLAADNFKAIPQTSFGTGKFTVHVTKQLHSDTLVVGIESIGVVGEEEVTQVKTFRLVRSVHDNDTSWSGVSKE